MIGKIAADAHPLPAPGMTGGNSATGAAAAADAMVTPVKFQVMPPASNQTVGATFQIAVTANNVHDLASVPMQLQFDPKVLQLVNVDDNGTGGLLGKDGQAVTTVHRDDGTGGVTVSETRPPSAKGVDGQGTICTLTFKAIAAGDTPIALVRVGAKDSRQNNLPAIGSQAIVHVK
jgi:general secretion pathway protein D